ncbi:MAG: DUF3885 domain-containing protein [Vagococcus sp.]
MNQSLRTIYSTHHHTYPLKENIRFELAHGYNATYYGQVAHNKQIDAVENGKKRALTLFHDIFKYSETIQMIFFISHNSSKSNIKKYLYKNEFKVIDSFVTNSLEDYYEGLTTVLVTETAKSNIRITKVIDGICYEDFYRHGKLRIRNPFVFYNAKDNIILNIYDDRGCDVWSDNLKRQKELFNHYYSWILDYDKENISRFYNSIE